MGKSNASRVHHIHLFSGKMDKGEYMSNVPAWFFLLLGCKRERTVSDFYVKVSLIGSQNVEHSIIWKKEHKVKVIEDTYKVRALIESKGNLQSNMKMGY